MRFEWPEVGRCLCCLPLRFGLLCVGYAKLMLNFFGEFMLIGAFINNYSYTPTTAAVIAILLIIYLALDFLFHVILIVGAHQKNHRTIRIYYRYSVTMFVISCLLSLGFVVYDVAMIIIYADVFVFLWFSYVYIAIIFVGFLLIYLVIQLYLVVLSRSEVRKLKNNQQFQFTNPTEYLEKAIPTNI